MTPTVILLHGLGRSRYSMSVLAWNLRRLGFRTINFGYPSRRHPIEESARRLADFLAPQVAAGEELHFVTHSLGGIVCRVFLDQQRERYRAGRIVMLGPPNRGSETARLIGKLRLGRAILGPALTQLMQPSFPLVRASAVGIIAGGTGRVHGLSPFLRGDNDGIVTVAETELEGAAVLLLPVGLHSFLMYYPRVQREVGHFLRHGKFA